jgi:hypothetical protein
MNIDQARADMKQFAWPQLFALILVGGLLGCAGQVKQQTSLRIDGSSNGAAAVVSANSSELACSIPKWADWLLTTGSSYRSIVNQFRGPCVQHDYCYRYGASTYGKTQKQCDNDLSAQLKLLCRDLNRPQFRWVCGLRRKTVDGALDLFGAWSFNGGGFFHEYDANPRIDHGYRLARVLPGNSHSNTSRIENTGTTESAGATNGTANSGVAKLIAVDELLSFAQSQSRLAIDRYRFHNGRFQIAAHLPIDRNLTNIKLLALARADTAPLVRNGDLVWPSALHQPVKGGEPLFARLSMDGTWQALYAADRPPEPVLAPWIDDFDGDGSIDYVTIEASRTKWESSACGQPSHAEDKSEEAYLAVYSASKDCASISVLFEYDTSLLPPRESSNERSSFYEDYNPHKNKFRKLQFPPLVGNFVSEPKGDPRKLEIIMFWHPPLQKHRNLMRAVLLQQSPCTGSSTNPHTQVAKGICWTAQSLAMKPPAQKRNSGEHGDNNCKKTPLADQYRDRLCVDVEFQPLTRVPGQNEEPDRILALDFSIASEHEQTGCARWTEPEAKSRIKRIAIKRSDDGKLFWQPLKVSVDASMGIDPCIDRSPVYLTDDGHVVLVQLQDDHFTIIEAAPGQDRIYRATRTACKVLNHSASTIAHRQILVGSFSQANSRELVFFDRMNPRRSILMQRGAQAYQPVGWARTQLRCQVDNPPRLVASP